MENISLTKKQQDEVLRSVRFGALAQLKEDSPVLLSIEDISIMINRSYNYTSRHIITRQDFPSPVLWASDNICIIKIKKFGSKKTSSKSIMARI
ncbi:TPA: hypothetical protein ACY37W_000178 [Pasteurella multocida]|nr:hypothetical protein E0Z11_05605 [Pasteurella multocida subsp. multocida]